MTARDLSLTLGAVVLLVAMGFIAFGQGAGETAPVAGPPSAGPDVGKQTPRAAQETVEIDLQRPGNPPPPKIDTSEWDHGMIRGDIELNPKAVAKIQSITVTLREARSGRGSDDPGHPPYNLTKNVPFSIGTPTFVFDRIPFSEFGYYVSVHSPGLNGSRVLTHIDEHNKYEEVRLNITPAVVFSVLLRDQFQKPVRDLDVYMVPEGLPLGRPTKHGTADSFGSLLFENVLAGSYQVLVGSMTRPRVDPVAVSVQRPGMVFNKTNIVDHQHVTITVPEGLTVQVQITDTIGSSVPQVELKIYRIDAPGRIFTEWEGGTSALGVCTFRNLPAGRYHLDVSHPWYRRSSRTFEVKPQANGLEQVIKISLGRR